MHTLVVLGSPRKNGNTEILAGAVINGIKEDGGKVEQVRLSKFNINPCVGCGSCEETGRCVIDDDMQKLYPRIDKADCVIIASPIYFYGVSAQTKLFIDRTQAMWSRKYVLKQSMKGDGSLKRFGIFISVAASRGKRVFDGAALTAQYCFDAMDINYGGKVVVPGIDRKGKMATAHLELERARKFGHKIVKMTGSLTP